MESKIKNLIGLQVIVEISEPWEVSITLDQVTIKAVIEKLENSEMLLRLHTPIKVKGKLCDCLVGSERYEGHSVSEILQGKTVDVSLTAISIDDSKKTDPFKFSSWKTGMGLIGSIKRKS